ncbi:hypothetical protein GY45DRAFT_1314639 [Cubamyces sp. BRFM 1775]|nr:hypothetical protein GY45DRAFT_1314639 [Cubamyces sp. BRFM 1775]
MPPLPSLITPAMVAALAAVASADKDIGMASASGPRPPEANGRKAGRMRATTSRTARNLYAVYYMKEHPNTTTREFDAIYNGLAVSTAQEYNAMHAFAATRPKDEHIDAIMEAFWTLSPEERATYNHTTTHHVKKTTTKGKHSGKGKAKAM